MGSPPLLVQVFEALPAPTFLVDEDVVVFLVNRAGRRLAAAPEGEPIPPRRGGELLRCVHATEHPDGCGRAEACRRCVVRGSVGAALRTGAVARRRARLELQGSQGDPTVRAVLVSASPVELGEGRMAVLTLEDVSELVQLGHEAAGYGRDGLVRLGGGSGTREALPDGDEPVGAGA